MVYLKLYFIGFTWNPGFAKSYIISRFMNAEDTYVYNIESSNLVIIGDSLTKAEYDLLCKVNKKGKVVIQYVAEPITKLLVEDLQYAKHLYETNACNAVFGCVKNGGYSVKYPLYAYDFASLYPIYFSGANANKYVNPCNKDFCVLINRHDYGNTRTRIYEELSKYGHITCPGDLFNNVSNEECNRDGITTYINKFKFNICCENFGAAHEGYITEKLMNACIGGAIPIYYGVLDDMDECIFNKDRIIFVTNETAHEVAAFVDELNRDEDRLREFYNRPIFKPTAADTIKTMNENMAKLFNCVREKLSDNSFQ